MGKDAERRLVSMANHFNWYRHKYGDVRKCKHCGEILPKTENAPDYAVAPIFTWVECKNNNSTGRWRWVEISEDGDRSNQRKWLLREGGWLLIELGLERAPKGKGAWLVPFRKWVKDIEPVLEAKGMKSIRYRESRGRPGADTILAGYECEWLPNVGWIPRNGHAWWKALYDACIAMATRIEHRRGLKDNG